MRKVKWVEEYNLIQAVLSGQEYKYAELVTYHQRYIFGLLCQITNSKKAAEELTCEVFVEAYRKLRKFKFETSFYIWVYKMALDKGVRFMENQTVDIPADSLYATFNPEEGTEYSEEDIQHTVPEFRAPLRKAYRQLSRKEQRFVIIKYFMELNYEELETVLGYPELKAKYIVYKIRMKMRKKLLQWGYL